MVGSPLIQNLKTRDDGSRLWQETAAALYNDLSSSRTTNLLRINWFNLAPPEDAAKQNRCCLAAPSTANKPPSRFCYGFVTVLSSELQGYVQPIVASQVSSDSGFGPVVLPLLHRDMQLWSQPDRIRWEQISSSRPTTPMQLRHLSWHRALLDPGLWKFIKWHLELLTLTGRSQLLAIRSIL